MADLDLVRRGGLSVSMALPEIVPLRERDLPAAVAALSRAFDLDPLQMYVFPDPVERAARSPALFTPLLRYGLLFGEVLTTAGGPVGAAVWLGPAAWEVTPERAKAAGLDKLPTVLGAAAAERFLSVLAAIDPYHHRDVPPAHWYVMVVGVAPEAQGTGIGQALLRPMIDRADAAGQPCYLETAQPTNLAFYEKLGFDRVVDTREPQSGLRLWTFRHSPLTPANRHPTSRSGQPRTVLMLSFFCFMKTVCNSAVADLVSR